MGFGLGLLALGPALAPGYVLSYDMVFLPRPPISAATLGLAGGPPRAVPSDAVIAVLSAVVPADLVQKIILVAIFTASCAGAAALLARCAERAGRRAPLPARLAAGVFYAWNPYVAERLILGHWALLLGYAALPWLVRSVWAGDRPVRPARLAAALVPAAVGGFAAVGISALAAVPVAAAGPAAPGHPARPARVRRLALVLGALAVASLPWLIPSLLVAVHTDPLGAEAFAARPDTPFGRIGSLLMLGGTWNEQVVPRGYGGAGSAVWLLVVLIALAGYLLLGWRRRTCPGLGSAAIAGFVIAAVGVTAPSRALLGHLIAAWPGFAVLRDGQRYAAPLALAEAIGIGLVTAWILTELLATISREPVTAPVAAGQPATVQAPGAPDEGEPQGRQPGIAVAPGPLAASRRAAARPASSLPSAGAPEPVADPGSAGELRTSGEPGPGPASALGQTQAHASGPAGTTGQARTSGQPGRDGAPAADGRPGAGRTGAGRSQEGGAGGRRATMALAVMAAIAPVLLLPGLAWGAAGRLHAVSYPADWLQARRLIDGDPRPGSVALLPWAAYRRYGWNDGEAVLDPWTKLLRRTVIWNDALEVGRQTVAAEDPAARRLTAALSAPGSLTPGLARAGVRYVVVDAGPLLRHPGSRSGCLAQAARLPGATVLLASTDLVVFRLPAAAALSARNGHAKHLLCPTADR